MTLKPKVALSQDFLVKLAKLPSAVHSKVLKWAIRFQSDPMSPGINYEKIHAARDPNLKSVRIDQDWRGIVFKPEQGDVYVLLYVDHHDDAYRWAESRKLAINPVTGAMQVVVLQEVVELSHKVVAEPVMPVAQPGLFDQLTDRDLQSLGAPEDWLERLRALHTIEALDELQPLLPVEAYEGLFLIAAGDTVNQVLVSRETRLDKKIDTSDFSAALETAESQSRFVVVEDDAALTAIMNAPLAQWRVFLHPTQRKLAVGDRSGPVRVLGGAGTGKTVLAMHRARWLAEHRTPEGKKVLFTTFTRNLAFDIEANLQSMCTPTTFKSIEVSNLDRWVQSFLRSKRYEHTIVYDRSKDAADAWQRALAVKDVALGLDDRFYQEELDHVVLAQGVTSRDEYRVARRTGRGVVLGRAKRDAIWPVFEEYRQQLSSRKLKEVDEAYRDAAALIREQGGMAGYSAIVVDETQDLGPQALVLLRAMLEPGPNDLFFVGDGHQRIYGRNRAAMSRCGIDIRGRSRKLYLNYRTTEEVRLQAVALLEGCEIDDLDDGRDESKLYKSLSHGPVPKTLTPASLEEALDAAWAFAKPSGQVGVTEAPQSCCVIASSRATRDAAERFFHQQGAKTHVIDANQKDVDDPVSIRFSTLHRAKGLEFDHVVVLAPSAFAGPLDETQTQRKLLYVALTRARRTGVLILT
jgi:hypothetical protein